MGFWLKALWLNITCYKRLDDLVAFPSQSQPEKMADAPKAPNEADLQAKAGALKSATTKEGEAKVAAEVIELYKKTYADSGGDKDKIMAALKLTADDVDDACFKDEAAFLSKTLGVKA